MLQAGDAAPDFTLQDGAGSAVSLRDLRGRKVIVYFYPKDDTPGCTIEACGFRDQGPGLAGSGAEVLGISPDGVDSHARFAAKFALPFRLLSDPQHQVAEAFGAWGERTLYGRKFMGILRSTFLVDEAGRVARAWPRVRVEGHAEEVLAALRGEAPPPARRRPAAKKKPTARKQAKKRPPAQPKKPAARKQAKKKPARRG